MLAGKAGVFQVSRLNDSVKEISLNKYWKFHNGDDSTWALISFDDS